MSTDLGVGGWFGIATGAAVVSIIGTLIGSMLKDLLFPQYLERWRERNSLRRVYRRFKDPLLLSSQELCTRLIEIVQEHPTNYLSEELLHRELPNLESLKPERNDIWDFYFRHYKLISTGYRLCSLLGWLEIYRQEVTFLNSGNNQHSMQLEDTINAIRSTLADGQLNDADDWNEWNDMLIFREELRAIGESMLCVQGDNKVVMGYSEFSELFENKKYNNDVKYRWLSRVFGLFLNLKSQRDFRLARILLLTTSLVDLIDLLVDSEVESRFIEARVECEGQLCHYSIKK